MRSHTPEKEIRTSDGSETNSFNYATSLAAFITILTLFISLSSCRQLSRDGRRPTNSSRRNDFPISFVVRSTCTALALWTSIWWAWWTRLRKPWTTQSRRRSRIICSRRKAHASAWTWCRSTCSALVSSACPASASSASSAAFTSPKTLTNSSDQCRTRPCAVIKASSSILSTLTCGAAACRKSLCPAPCWDRSSLASSPRSSATCDEATASGMNCPINRRRSRPSSCKKSAKSNCLAWCATTPTWSIPFRSTRWFCPIMSCKCLNGFWMNQKLIFFSSEILVCRARLEFFRPSIWRNGLTVRIMITINTRLINT